MPYGVTAPYDPCIARRANRGASGQGPQVSVCILASHGIEQLEACLGSLAAQVHPPTFELLVGGEHTPAGYAVVERHFPDAQLCDTPRRPPGAARNVLIERARGELLLFLDDDVTCPPDLLCRLADAAARHPHASVFGGPNLTPPGSSRFQVVQGAVLSSLVGSGPVSRRYGARHAGFADERWFTLCNLAIRRQAMMPFAHELVCAEENDLLARLRRRAEPMRYEPGLRVFHARRSGWRPFARQMFKYGRGRGQVLARRPSTIRTAYLAPVALLAYLVTLLAAVTLSASAPLLALTPLGSYGVLVLGSGGWIALTLRRATAAPVAVALILTVHLCYGSGVARGLLGRRRRGSRQPAHSGQPRISAISEALVRDRSRRPISSTRAPGS